MILRRAALATGLPAVLLLGSMILPAAPRAQGTAPAPQRLAIKGYDPVAYFTDSKPTPGVETYQLSWDGQIYRFASAAHLDLFEANPDKYAPQFGGSCAMNMSAGVRRESDPHNWVISNGHLYVFAGAVGLENFRKNPESNAAKATVNWQSLRTAPTH
jgi:YHS domain-containing protein